MIRTILSLLMASISTVSNGQVKPPLAINEYEIGLNPIDEIPLFDLQEIKSRNIDSVYIIYHPGSWAEYHPNFNPCTCPYNDTLALYRFDAEGRIIQYTSFAFPKKYSTTITYDSLGRRKDIAYSSDTSVSKQVFFHKKEDADSIITEITLWRFKHGFDTAFIQTNRYNSNRILVETQSQVNKRNAREIGDDTGVLTFHFKYDYDEKGRLIYYRDFESNEYQKISYPFFGKLTDIYNSKTNQLVDRQVKLIKEHDGIITITFDRKQISLTPLEKGSKLFKLRTIVEPGNWPLMYYHEIVYIAR